MIVSVPGASPGIIVPAINTLLLMVPVPLRVPPCIFTIVLAEGMGGPEGAVIATCSRRHKDGCTPARCFRPHCEETRSRSQSAHQRTPPYFLRIASKSD